MVVHQQDADLLGHGPEWLAGDGWKSRRGSRI
jgi:hypothetical protein